MYQRLLSLVIVIITLFWIVVSYLPGVHAKFPTLSIAGNGSWLAWLNVVALIAFLTIQLWLVHTTVTTIRHYQTRGHALPFRLRLGSELFWTALPIAMTIGLACASYALWLNLLKP